MSASQSPTSTSRSLDNRSTLRQHLDISHFSPNAILRGVQLTLVGAQRALQNPALFTSDHYRHAAYAVAAGIAIRIVMEIPIILIRATIWVISLSHLHNAKLWLESFNESLNFIGEHVLQLPLFLMTLMRHVSPTLDNLFMQSLRWVDITYVRKHQGERLEESRSSYYTNLEQYPRVATGNDTPHRKGHTIYNSIYRHCHKALVSIIVYFLSFLPVVGPIILPLVSFYTFHKAVGLGLAGLIFGSSLVTPKRYIIVFLQTYFSTRTFTRELLEPYFSRVQFSQTEKRNWFRSREGVLFGFGFGFYILLKIPLVGVLIYGIAEASTAYLITKITDPPPPSARSREFAESQQQWRNKQKFLTMLL
ncbi:hypothetical protein CP533_0297 [Ophiocordyceps camponoti-saundersi (nom. inval.)]|nr:hypothetical protein CP533_0297 [Ophiocordyceps camponoti-saundersi (nom. inval.)]